ncbi:hypothetical protein AcV7_004673 [Taiwanofungus camphoratus]|nr:hypothetical protein AcV7_004673 [Antrodia cinnamomea]
MAHSDSEDEALDDAEFDRTTEGDEDVDEDILDALEGDLAAAEEGTEGEDESYSEESDGGSDDDEAEDEEQSPRKNVGDVQTENLSDSVLPGPKSLTRGSPSVKITSPPRARCSLSPTQARRARLISDISWPKSYTVEAICAIPHPAPTHSLASSLCMTHLLTGSDDGYIRDYDIFSAVNGKIFLTAPQRHHCGVMEGLMKAGQIKCWWENPLDSAVSQGPPEESPLSAVYSLAMQSDALWTLAGSEHGHVNLFTVRHDPGRLCYTMRGHRGPVTALALQHDEKGFFSAGLDGEALQWDLNTGQVVRNFTTHGAQLAAIAVRPLTSDCRESCLSSSPRLESQTSISMHQFEREVSEIQKQEATLPHPVSTNSGQTIQSETTPVISNGQPDQEATTISQRQDEDSKSDTSYDPLFDDEPDADGELDNDDDRQPSTAPPGPFQGSLQGPGMIGPAAHPALQPSQTQMRPSGRSASTAVAPKNAPPILDPITYTTFSPNVLMTASIDGQIIIWDTRSHTPKKGVGRLWMSEKTPPWCVSACWSADGAQIYAGRRNGTIDVWDVRQTGRAASGTPKILKTLRNPISSGVVSCVVAFPDGRHLACASNDNIRLWNVAEAGEPDASGRTKSGVQFKIIPGHHGGMVSQMRKTSHCT